MNLSGIITNEELKYLKDIFEKAYKGSKTVNLAGNIFFASYLLLVACLLLYGIIYRQGLILLIFTCFVPVVVYSKFYNRKYNRIWKKYKKFNSVYNTDENTGEHTFCSDKNTYANNNISVKYIDTIICMVLNGYTLLTDKDGRHFVLKTDVEQQWQIFQILKDNNIPVSMVGDGKEKPFSNKLILDYVKNVGVKKKQKKKRKVMLCSLIVTVALYIIMIFIANQNNYVKNDTSTYNYINDGKLFAHQQMTENYSNTKSYKAMYDIYFDWVSQTHKRAIAITSHNDKITQIEIICKDENNVSRRLLYQDASDKQMVVVCNDIIDDWHSSIMNLSNFKALSSSHPYVLRTADLGFILYSHLSLKDNHISTFVNDTMNITFGSRMYHCESADGDYNYVIYVDDKEIHSSEEIYEYFNNISDEALSVPYDKLSFTSEDIGKILEPYISE